MSSLCKFEIAWGASNSIILRIPFHFVGDQYNVPRKWSGLNRTWMERKVVNVLRDIQHSLYSILYPQASLTLIWLSLSQFVRLSFTSHPLSKTRTYIGNCKSTKWKKRAQEHVDKTFWVSEKGNSSALDVCLGSGTNKNKMDAWKLELLQLRKCTGLRSHLSWFKSALCNIRP